MYVYCSRILVLFYTKQYKSRFRGGRDMFDSKLPERSNFRVEMSKYHLELVSLKKVITRTLKIQQKLMNIVFLKFNLNSVFKARYL